MPAADLFGDVRAYVPQPWSEILVVAAAFVCGGIVGSERERQEKPAGLRTLILICMGSAIFTVVSMSAALGRLDPARIAAQIVTGVGFLGAGTILRDRHSVRGITTAASIWATAAVGIAAGAGYVVSALALALTIWFTLWALPRLELRLGGRCQRVRVRVLYRPERGKTRACIQEVVDDEKGLVALGPERDHGDGMSELSMEYCQVHREHRSVLAALAEVPGVEGFENGAD
jgi:putative Mg2+ transporter-C (MgtC) family protein